MASFKVKSAMEYLVTYGWMVLVIAVVGGAIIATVQQQTDACESRITSIDAQPNSFGVTDFGYVGGDVYIEFENDGEETINLTGVSITPSNGDTSVTALATRPEFTVIGRDESSTVEVAEGVSSYESGDCGMFDVSVNYTETSVESTISGRIQDTV